MRKLFTALVIAASFAAVSFTGSPPAVQADQMVPVPPRPKPRDRVPVTSEGSQAIATVNAYRKQSGLGAVLDYTPWSGEIQKHHARYMLLNEGLQGSVAHAEYPGTPGYSSAGNRAAAESVTGWTDHTRTTQQGIIDRFMSAPLHAMSILNPRTTAMAFGQAFDNAPGGYKHAWAMNTTKWVRYGSGPGRTVLFPGNGATVRLRSAGLEFPTPQDQCGAGYGLAQGGLPIFAQFARRPTQVRSVTLTGPGGVPVTACVKHAGNASGEVGSILGWNNAVLIMPKGVLENGGYTARVETNVGTAQWSFTIRGQKQWICEERGLVTRCRFA